MPGLAPKWPEMGQIRYFFMISFSIFWLAYPKCTETDPKNTTICPISDQADPTCSKVWHPCLEDGDIARYKRFQWHIDSDKVRFQRRLNTSPGSFPQKHGDRRTDRRSDRHYYENQSTDVITTFSGCNGWRLKVKGLPGNLLDCWSRMEEYIIDITCQMNGDVIMFPIYLHFSYVLACLEYKN